MGPTDDRSSWELKRLVIAFAVAAVVIAVIDLTQPSEGIDRAQAVEEAPVAVAVDASPTAQPAVAQAGPLPPAAPLPASFTLAVTGEILPHPSVVEHAARFGAERSVAYDFAGLFADVSPVIASADLAICHLEVPVAPPGREPSGYPAFAIPAEIGDGIRDTGWDRCSTASNHSNDQGRAGIVATLDALDAAQVGHSGMARTMDEAMSVPMADAGGVPVAHLSYTWGFNATPPSDPWMVNTIDPSLILADAAYARTSGAAIVVVSLHWGEEYDTAGTGDQRALAALLLASPDIDLVVGHGPHVLQPIEQVGDEYALLSVGNLVANQGRERSNTYDGVVATITFTRGEHGRYVAATPVVEPTWYDREAGRVRLVTSALGDPALVSIRSELAASAERTREIMGSFVVTG